MSQYLRDESLRNIDLDEESIRKINESILEIAKQTNATIQKDQTDKLLICSYVIRFDNKGFRLYDLETIMKYFQDARYIERFIFLLESAESIRTYRLSGNSVELKFDGKDINNCSLVVQSDDNNWVDATFWKLKERLSRYKNKNFIIRNKWTPIFIQLLGVTVGFLVSLWVAVKLSPRLQIENSLAFAFVITFLLFSNIWTFLYAGIGRIIDYFWPNISFKKIKGIHWLLRALLSTMFVSIFLFLLGRMALYLTQLLKSLIKV